MRRIVATIPAPNGADTATLIQKGRGRYALIATNTNRVRFGNVQEIRKDCEHFRTLGTFPPMHPNLCRLA
jgi:hypothetical protein